MGPELGRAATRHLHGAAPYRVAMVAACPFPYPRGTPVRILHMADALARRGHDVHVVTYHLGERARAGRFAVHRIPDVPTYRNCSPGPTWQKLAVVDPLLAVSLARVLWRHRIDVVHAHHVEGLLVALAAVATRPWHPLPVVFDAHTLLESELPFYALGLGERAKAWLGRTLDARLPRRAAHVIAVTEDVERRLLALAPALAGRTSVITSGVELEHFGGERARAAWAPGWRGAPRTLVYAGNLAAYQGIDLMLRAFAEVRRTRRDVRLRLVSDSPFGAYEPLAAALGVRDAIDVVPSRFDDLPRHLAGAAVALNPRTSCDGIPQKLLNYMAAGRPIVSFAGSAKDLTHGTLGWVVADGDVPGFARAIHRLLDDPALARSLGENALAYVRAERSWERVAERTEEVYRRVAPRGTGRPAATLPPGARGTRDMDATSDARADVPAR